MKKRHLILLAILISALCLRLYRLSWNILICDELSSVLWWIDLSFVGKLIRSATIEPSPPLYFIVLHSWIKLFGGTELSIRFLSVLMGLFSIIILYLIGKELIDIRAGLGGALLMAISPYHIFYTTYARMYALLLFLVLLSWYSFIKLVKEDHRKWLWCYIIFTALSLYTHYSALYTILVQNLYFFIFWKEYRRIVRLWIKALIGVTVLFLPWIPIFLKDLFFSEWSLKTTTTVPLIKKLLSIKYIFISNFMPNIGRTYFELSLEDLYSWKLLKWIAHLPFLIPVINSLILVTFAIFFISGIAYLFKDKKRFTLLSLYLFILFFFFLFVSRYNRPRFFLQICPAFYIIVACGILCYKGKVKVLSIGLLLLLHLIPLNIYYSQIKISPVKTAFAYLETAYQKGDPILINSYDIRNIGTSFWYYNRFQNNAEFDIYILRVNKQDLQKEVDSLYSELKSCLPLETGVDRNNAKGYEKTKKHFRPFLERLKIACGYRNIEDIFNTISLNALDRKERIWYVGDENRSFLGKNKEVIALLENRSFTPVTCMDFGRTRLYLLEKSKN